MVSLLFTLAATQLPVQTVPVFDESITFDGTVAGGISGFAAAIIAKGSLGVKVNPGIEASAELTYGTSSSLTVPAGLFPAYTLNNAVTMESKFKAATSPCNLLTVQVDISAQLNIEMGNGASTAEDVTCVGGNMIDCIYTLVPLMPKLMQPFCYDQQGEKTETKCKQLKIAIPIEPLLIDFSDSISDLSFKISYLLSAAGGVGQLLSALGCDITWSIRKIDTSFTGVQMYLDMDLYAIDLTKSNIPAVAALADSSAFKAALGVAKITLPVFTKTINMVNLAKQVVEATDPNLWPVWLNLPATSQDDLAITAGKMDTACAKSTPAFSMSLLGSDLAGLEGSTISAALVTALQAKVEAAAGFPLPDCTTMTTAMKVSDDKDVASKLWCLFQEVTVTPQTTMVTNSEGRRLLQVTGVTVAGKTSAGSGMNGGGINTILAAAVTEGMSLTVDGNTIEVSKDAAGIDGCTTEEAAEAGNTNGCGNNAPGPTPAPAPGAPTPAPAPGAPTPAPGPGSSGMTGGEIFGVVIGCLVGVGAVAFIGVKGRERYQLGGALENHLMGDEAGASSATGGESDYAAAEDTGAAVETL